MSRPILVADLFCGAGGSSTGAAAAIEAMGRRMDLVCVNHWDRAIETHTRMHPQARHWCQDVASARPIECVPEGRLDLLMASPTCTYHSRARGGRPTSDQQRMDPWHVVTWLTELRVDRLLIENVPEFADWGPVDARSGRPIKSKRGQYHREWVATLDRLDFEYSWKFLVCADYGDATTRKRYFGLGRRRNGRRSVVIRWPEPTHTREPRHDLLAPLQRWRPARECIDWSMKGRSIFGRKKPLAARTIQRIYAGAVRFAWPEPYLVVLRNHMEGRSIDLPVPTIAAEGTHIGLVEPVLIQAAHGVAPHERLSAHDRRTRALDDPLGTIHAGGGSWALADPIIVGAGGRAGQSPALSIDSPLGTITTKGDRALVEPFVLSQASGGAPRSVSRPLPTITTGGRQGEGTALITPYYGSGSGETCKSVDVPLDTVTTLPRFGLIVPVTHADGSNRARDVNDPLPTLTTAPRGELAFITASFGERDGQMPRTHDIELPMPTIPATGSVRLAQGGEQYDILFRMLHWRELARATSLEDYDFAGTATEITKQIGNAVPRRMAQALVSASLHDMQG